MTFLAAVQILHTGFIFETELYNAKVKLVSSQKRLMMSFDLNIGQKMLRFWKETLEDLSIKINSPYFNRYIFSGTFCQ